MATMKMAGRVVVYGGKGALGSTCVKYFRDKNWSTISIDLKENEEADVSIVLEPKNCWWEQYKEVNDALYEVLENGLIDAFICVSGGWAGGNASSDEMLCVSDKMWKQSVWPSVISARLVSKLLKEGGFFALAGAKAALQGTPNMIGYGLAKAAVHQLVKSLGGKNSGMPKEALVVGILPTVLDTSANRESMPNADFSSWTPTRFVAELFYKWAIKIDRPESGKLVQLFTERGKTAISFI